MNVHFSAAAVAAVLTHYPSDVAGGWAAALVWLAVCITGVNMPRHCHAEVAFPAAVATLAAATADQRAVHGVPVDDDR